MLNIGAPEMLVILLVALLVLGPERLPSAARQVGKVMGELRRMSSGFQAELRDALEQEEAPRYGDQPPLAPSPYPADPAAPEAATIPADPPVDAGPDRVGDDVVGEPDPGAGPDRAPGPNTP